jgi:hypothetical protein
MKPKIQNIALNPAGPANRILCFIFMGGSLHYIPGPGLHFWGAQAPPKTEPRGIQVYTLISRASPPGQVASLPRIALMGKM